MYEYSVKLCFLFCVCIKESDVGLAILDNGCDYP